MSKWRRAARTDANQTQIVKELRSLGYSVEPGHDDLLIGYRGKTFWYEIKTGPKAVVKESQKKLLAEYKGHYKIVWSTEMIIDDIKQELSE